MSGAVQYTTHQAASHSAQSRKSPDPEKSALGNAPLTQVPRASYPTSSFSYIT
jgi:hypothetical protein